MRFSSINTTGYRETDERYSGNVFRHAIAVTLVSRPQPRRFLASKTSYLHPISSLEIDDDVVSAQMSDDGLLRDCFGSCRTRRLPTMDEQERNMR